LRDTQFERTPQRRERGKYLAEGVLACFRCHSDRDWNLPGRRLPAAKKVRVTYSPRTDGPGWSLPISVLIRRPVPAAGPMT
jgi:hypothetical protein